MGVASSSQVLPELPASSRYELLFKLASGGMASVYVGRLRGAGGFWRLVAIKKAHAHLVEDPAFRRMIVEEARLASKIHHPNVVGVLDVEQVEDQLLLVMDYVEGASLSDVLGALGKEPLSPRLAVRIALDACAGLRAAHELTDASGKPLHIVHRDVSPQNLLVGVDGVARLADFGIAKSAQQGASTTTGALKGKLAYMAPEYVDGKPPDQRSDVFGLGVVIWEALANRRLFRGETEVDTLKRVLDARVPPLSSVAPWASAELDPVLAAALAKDPNERFSSAKAFGNALEIAARRADLVGSAEEVGALVQRLFEQALADRRRVVQERVAADVGPASRPTVPTPRRSEGARAVGLDGAASGPKPQRAARALAATVNDDGSAQAASPDSGAVSADHHGSTLDGSGMSRTGLEPPPSAVPAPSRRAAWIAGACAALVAGGLAAVAVSRWMGSSPAPAEPGAAPTGGPARDVPAVTVSSLPEPPLASVVPDPRPSAAASASSTAAASASSTAAHSTAAPAASSSARKPSSPGKTPAADVLPNPYVTKP
jgi:serine/threonine-protein kinase